MTRIDVTSERATYAVIIGAGLVASLKHELAARDLDRQLLVVSCPPVWKLHGRRLSSALGSGVRPALLADGERAKTLASASKLYDACLTRRLDRSGTILAFGGGVVGDVAGFAAATFLRGLRLVQVPTTLLAQVDSAIGGKVGVNLRAGKNLVGAFHSPSLVACDPEVLRTLPAREFRAGLYEIVKYGVIASSPLFDRVSRDLNAIVEQDPDLLTQIVGECCRIKADVVMRDERETGPRRALNFGHTIGHALEAVTDYRRFRHGEAIGYGMLAAAWISARRGSMAADEEARLQDLIRRMGRLPPVTDLRARDALAAIARDKKVVKGRLHFVLARGIGATEIAIDVTPAELTSAMQAIGLR